MCGHHTYSDKVVLFNIAPIHTQHAPSHIKFHAGHLDAECRAHLLAFNRACVGLALHFPLNSEWGSGVCEGERFFRLLTAQHKHKHITAQQAHAQAHTIHTVLLLISEYPQSPRDDMHAKDPLAPQPQEQHTQLLVCRYLAQQASLWMCVWIVIEVMKSELTQLVYRPSWRYDV